MGGAIDWQRRLNAAAPGLVERCTVVGVRPRSVILRGHSPAFGDVAIKYDARPQGLSRIRAEYEALRAYHRASGPGDFGVARPCALVPDQGHGAALVTSWIDGTRADDCVGGLNAFGSGRREVLRRSARWLARFHDLGQVEERPLQTVLDLPSLEAEVAAALRVDRHDPSLDALSRSLAQSVDTPIRVAVLHGDFLPQNLFLCETSTVGIDFTLEVTGPVLCDAGNFLANMVWRGYSSLDPRRSARFAGDAQGFVDAYYGGATPPERLVAHLFILAGLARKATGLSAKIARLRLGASGRVHRRMLAGAIRHLLRHPGLPR